MLAQLSSLLNMPLDKVGNEIDRIWEVLPEPEKKQYDIDGELKTCRELGVTAKMITHFGLNNGMDVHIMSGGAKDCTVQARQMKETTVLLRCCLGRPRLVLHR